jgi:choline monooxygenase
VAAATLQAEGKGHAGGNIVCPIHRWTYSSSGELLGAPHFKRDPCLSLSNYPLRQWNGLLFEDNGRDITADLAGMAVARDLSFDGYVLDHVELHECNYNWKTFIEVYLEDYHVGPFHPGLGNFVTCDDLKLAVWGRVLGADRGPGAQLRQARLRRVQANGTRCC